MAEHGFRQHHHAVVWIGQPADHGRGVRRAGELCCASSSPKLRERSAVHESRGVRRILPAVHRRSIAKCSPAGSKRPSARQVWPKKCARLKAIRSFWRTWKRPPAAPNSKRFIADFTRTVTGTDRELFHPDFTQPILLMGDEDPLPQIRAHAPPRYSYRTLELLARDFEDELKQVESVGKVTKVAIVQESVYLLFSDANIAGYGLTPKMVMDSISARNAVIPGGTVRTEGRNFPVQLSGEYKTEHDMLGTVVGLSREGAPVYLRDVFEVRRMYESPIPYKVDVLGRTGTRRPARHAPRRDGRGRNARRQNHPPLQRGRDEGGGCDEDARSPRAWSSACSPTSPPPSSIAFITSCTASSRRCSS